MAQGNDRSVRLRISLPRPDMADAVVGGFARATLNGTLRSGVLSVPRTAVASDEGETAVFLFEAGRARRRVVRLGRATGPRIEVLEGLRGGEQVIADGAGSLTDGQAVRPKPERGA